MFKQFKKRRVISLAMIVVLVSGLLCNSIVSAGAMTDTISSSGGSGQSDVVATITQSKFSVTVPTVLPISVDANQNVTVADNAQIVNNSNGPVMLYDAEIVAKNDWNYVGSDADFKDTPVDSKDFSMKFLNEENLFDSIPGNSSRDVDYDANVAVQSSSIDSLDIADVIFTVAWDEYLPNEPSFDFSFKNYTLNYIYLDRNGNEKTYTISDSFDDAYYDENGTWIPTKEFIYENAPAIDDIFKSCKWVITDQSLTVNGTVATVRAIQEHKSYTVNIYDANGNYDTLSVPFNGFVYKDGTTDFYVADATDASGVPFRYWSVTENGREVTRHYYRSYTKVVLGNYTIKPIYSEEDATDSVYISEPQYSREQYTNADGTNVDYVYADFMLNFVSVSDELIRNNSDKYQTGLLVELGQNYVLPTDENGAVTDADYTKITYTSSSDEKLKEATSLESSKSLTYNMGTSDNRDYRKIYNFTINNSSYNNMNRLVYNVCFKNTNKNRLYVMKAYYYVIKDGSMVVSEPVYFNLYNIGTSSAVTG